MVLLQICIGMSLPGWICLAIFQSGPREQPAGTATLKWDRPRNGGMAISIGVNGHTGKFIFDTGTTWCILSDSFAERLSLPRQPAIGTKTNKPISVNGKDRDLVHASEVRLGSLKYRDIPFILLQTEELSMIAGEKIDGILGANFLYQVPVMIDFVGKTVTFIAAGPLPTAYCKSRADYGFSELPLVIQPDVRFAVPIIMGGSVEDSLIIDTGSPYTIVSTAAARKLKLRPTRTVKNLRQFHGVYDMNFAEVKVFSLGRSVIEDMEVAYSNADDPLLRILGRDILSRFYVVIDVAGKKAFIKPVPPSLRIPESAAGSGP